MPSKLRGWWNRYFWAELAGVLTAVVVSNLARMASGSLVVAAFVATWLDNLAFYGVIAWRDWRKRKDRGSVWGVVKLLRNLLVEFGSAEYLDSFVIRPFYLAVVPLFVSNYSLAILIGTILANVTYYVPTIIGYEVRKKAFRD